MIDSRRAAAEALIRTLIHAASRGNRAQDRTWGRRSADWRRPGKGGARKAMRARRPYEDHGSRQGTQVCWRRHCHHFGTEEGSARHRVSRALDELALLRRKSLPRSSATASPLGIAQAAPHLTSVSTEAFSPQKGVGSLDAEHCSGPLRRRYDPTRAMVAHDDRRRASPSATLPEVFGET